MARRRNSNRLNPAVVVAALILVVASFIYGKWTEDVPSAGSETGKLVSDEDLSAAHDDLYLHFIDVGQGDCSLIRTPSGKFMLIDAGTNSSAQKVVDYLKDNGVSEIEYAVFSHPHEDHIGGAESVIENFRINNILMSEKTASSSTYERMVDAVLESKKTNGTKVFAPVMGDEYTFDGVTFKVLAPFENEEDTNDSSIVIRVVFGNCAFLYTGDASSKVEKKLLQIGSNVTSVLLKCGHHGSSTSSCMDFLKEVSPKAAVASCGLDNIYGHPHSETLQRLSDVGAKVFRTDEMGDIVFSCDGDNLALQSLSKE